MSFFKNQRTGGTTKARSHAVPRSRSTIVESQGPAGRSKGTCSQLVERYVSLGKDALKEGDGVLAENFFQHAEHYRRLAGSFYQAPEEDTQDHHNHPAHSAHAPGNMTKITGSGAASRGTPSEAGYGNESPQHPRKAPGRRVQFNRSVPTASFQTEISPEDSSSSDKSSKVKSHSESKHSEES
ncbi:MAG: hypothetical protein BGO07_03325 [Alphaproteobacteria bacterium 40-19]|nr:MAG: hypothetical protein BGO07_03325 [Alphaproteobacteria bacterium 40-19]